MSAVSRPSSSQLALAGCGGAGPTAADGTAQLWVTRDRGSEVHASTPRCPAGQTLLRALKSKAKVSTRYGGGFVQSIDGVDGSARRHRDWFWFVNGLAGDRSANLLPPPRRRRRVVGLPRLVGRRRHARGRRRRLPGAVPARLRRQDAAGRGALRRRASAPGPSRSRGQLGDGRRRAGGHRRTRRPRTCSSS